MLVVRLDKTLTTSDAALLRDEENALLGELEMYALIVMVLANWSDGGSASSSTPGFESYELCSAAKQRVEQHFGAVMPKLNNGGAQNLVVAECVRVKQ